MPPSHTRAHIQKAQSYHQAPPPRQMPNMPMPHPSFTQHTQPSPVSDDGHRNPPKGHHGWMSSAARVGAQTANTLANSTTATRQDVAGRLAWYSLPTTAPHSLPGTSAVRVGPLGRRQASQECLCLRGPASETSRASRTVPHLPGRAPTSRTPRRAARRGAAVRTMPHAAAQCRGVRRRVVHNTGRQAPQDSGAVATQRVQPGRTRRVNHTLVNEHVHNRKGTT